MQSNSGEYRHKIDHPTLKYSDDSAHDYDETSRYSLMSKALKELLIEREVVNANEIREYLDFMDSRGEQIGAEIIAKAWTEPDFKKKLKADGTGAVGTMNIPMAGAELIVVENTEDIHNLVVCTLCSCYPRGLLGPRTVRARATAAAPAALFRGSARRSLSTSPYAKPTWAAQLRAPPSLLRL